MTAPYFDKKPHLAVVALLAIFSPFVYVLSLSVIPLKLVIFNQILFFLLPSIAFIKYHKLGAAWDFHHFSQRIVLTLVVSLALTHVLNLAIAHWTKVFPLPPEYEQMYDDMLHKGQKFGLWWDLFQLALVPAICEEFFFRGCLQTSLNHYLKSGAAIVITALVFTLYHFNIWYAPFYFILGWFFGWLFARKGNLLFAITAHVINNAYGVMVYHFFESGP